MMLLSYDISKTPTRTKFAKFIQQYGHRVQYSVWQIENSPRLLRIIQKEIDGNFSKKFQKTDSVYIYRICEGCEKNAMKYGYAKHEDEEIIILK
jgi:CRISPR-associated protein Cas2